MVRDAEEHAAEDHKRRETAEARNQLDSLVYTTEKSLKEHGESVDAATRGNIEQALERAKKALEGQDADEMKTAAEQLSTASHKLAEAIYAKTAHQTEAGADGQAGGGAPGGEGQTSGGKKDDVVDADFEEVK